MYAKFQSICCTGDASQDIKTDLPEPTNPAAHKDSSSSMPDGSPMDESTEPTAVDGDEETPIGHHMVDMHEGLPVS